VIADSTQLKPNLSAHHSVELHSDGSWWSAEGSDGDNSSRIGKAFVLAHGGGLQHPLH